VLRVSLAIEKLPFVIATSGHGGHEEFPAGGTWMKRLQDKITPAQVGATDPVKHPEYVGNAVTLNTWDYWRNDSISPAESVHHWNLNSESFSLIGMGLAEVLIKLLPDETVSGKMLPQGIKPIEIVQGAGSLRVQIEEKGHHRIYFYNISGSELLSRTGEGPRVHTFENKGISGLIFMKIDRGKGISWHKLLLNR